MDQYNNTIISKIVDYVKYSITIVKDRDAQEREVKLNRYEVAEVENIDLSTLQNLRQTATIDVDFYFDILDKDGNKISTSESSLKIPRLINNMFVIDGKPRISTQTLDNASDCRVNEGYIQINYQLKAVFNDPSRPNEFYIETIDDDLNPVTITRSQLDEAVINQDQSILNLVKLSELEILKLKIKLDTDTLTDYLTSDMLTELYKLGPDKYQDSIIDKRISTTESDLIAHLYFWKNRSKVRMNIAKKFRSYGEVYLRDIQNLITRYFRVANDPTLSIPDIINPLIYDSMKYKILLPLYLAYNESFSDLIDPVNTPENNNVNRINELNVCTSIIDGVIYIDCYKLDGTKIKMKYLEYLNHHVLNNNDYDYDNNKVIERDQYTLKLRLKEVKVSKLLGISDLIVEPKPDEKLSVTTRRIPLINVSDSVRVAMGAAMSKQAIEVESSEPALVGSGNDNDDLSIANQIIRYKSENGEVIGIRRNQIFIKDLDNGSIDMFTISQPTVGQNESVVSYKSVVSVGQKVKKDDPIVAAKLVSRGSYELGINARCFYMNYLGFTHEDGIVISESFANKLTAYNIAEVSIRLRVNTNLIKLLPIGSKVVSGDALVTAEVPLNVSQNVKDAFTDPVSIMGRAGLGYSEYNLITPNNIDEGYVAGIKIQKNPGKEFNNPNSESIIGEFQEANYIDPAWEVLPDQYRRLDILDSDMRDEVYLVTYKIVKVKRAVPGVKLCNRYGSKGEVSLVIPDELMPRMDLDGEGNGPSADILLNPAAVIARKNVSQLYEALLGKLIDHIYRSSYNLKMSMGIDAAKKYTIGLYGNKFTNMSDDEFVAALNKGIHAFKFETGSYARFDLDKLMKIAEDYGVNETQYVYCPDIAIGESDNGIQCFNPDSLNGVNAKHIKVHELGFVESPVIDGFTYFMRLFHSSDFSGKVTPSKIDSKYPYMKRGLYRDMGQKIGEMELWSLLSYGTESYVREGSDNKLTSQYEFINEMLLAGYTLVDDNELPLLSEYRSKINRLKLSDLVKK